MSDVMMNSKSRRDAQSLATRALIVRSALHLMLERGYIPTTIVAIASEAGVAVQTVYNSVGGKAAILSAVLDLASVQPIDDDIDAAPLRSRIGSAGSAAEVVRILTEWIADLNERTSGVHRVISQASGVDTDITELETRRSTQRLMQYGEVATALRSRHSLRAGLSDHEAAAAVWSLGHPHVYRSLVLDLGWSVPAYRDWLGKALQGALSPPGARGGANDQI
ncbi:MULTISPECIES: TetR/AcrR family transcriptional regulator [Cryobacterium]|uniref:TetR/AcrR family transcriptional regulator n=1 Tax=Cryobacterium breve TaxID=1259258 RepID=A0ABY2J072_9MICO|nr:MULTISPECIES: TetR/AcrR family transcriptional regulator [Cryobacterium]TFC96943.1 TetR/AcrR family transcriptional regulator [Cryobacterium sp. TmT3-12]TFC97261.1 TetR/AcrR family transcriptional regulator [Cryobacterium breve]